MPEEIVTEYKNYAGIDSEGAPVYNEFIAIQYTRGT